MTYLNLEAFLQRTQLGQRRQHVKNHLELWRDSEHNENPVNLDSVNTEKVQRRVFNPRINGKAALSQLSFGFVNMTHTVIIVSLLIEKIFMKENIYS